MITTLHPKYFINGNNKQLKGERIPEDKLIFWKYVKFVRILKMSWSF